MAEKAKKKRVRWTGIIVPFIILMIGGWFLWQYFQPRAVDTSEGLEILKGETVSRVVLNEGTQQVNLTLTQDYTHEATGLGDRTRNLGKNVYFTYSYTQTDDILTAVAEKDPVRGWNAIRPQGSAISAVLQMVVPILILMLAFWFLMSRLSGSRMMGGFAQSKVKEFNQERPDISFADVAGEDEAVEELEEIREFLASPDKFHKVGARIPRGVLLYGPPGTGKTLLAKAVAGEAHAPFFSISGSEFMELYVGVGASRVRDLFERAKKAAPAIIFVDEIDAVGRHRGSGIGGGNDEREQTLNQLLVEMDGFDERANIIMIAATNRPDILDPALLRPGRFDRQIAVEAPDLKGREAILKVHAGGKPMTNDVDLRQIAKRTPGFTGADLANVLNEAALLTARSNADLIDNRAIDEAIDRVIAGPQKRTRVMNDHDKAVTAYHEGGHALCAAALRYTDPVTKVTILPRGRALGYTMVMPTEDRFNHTRNQLLDELVYAMGGRVAEELVFRDPSTGPANDIQQATKTARAMITDYGMSDRVGLVKLGTTDTEAFGHGGGSEARPYSNEMAGIIDDEVRLLLDGAMREAWEILTKNRDVLDTLAQRLLDEETLDEAQLAEIFKDVVKQDERPVWNYGADAAIEGARLGNPVGIPSAQTPTAPAPEADRVEEASASSTNESQAGGELMAYDAAGVEKASRDLLIAIGEDPTREGLAGTPDRMARAWREMLSGLEEDPRDYLRTQFEAGTDELVLVRDITFHSICEHHLLPFYGRAHVGYIPCGGKVTGLSKLARVVEGYARRPQVQERLTAQIADAIDEVLHPQGVIVVMEAEHMCMSMRGITKPGSSTVTSALRGIMNDGTTRAEMMALVLGGDRS